MATIRITNITMPCGHIVFDLLINGTNSLQYKTTLSALQSKMNEVNQIEFMLSNAWNEKQKAGAETLAQIRNALLNKEFFL